MEGKERKRKRKCGRARAEGTRKRQCKKSVEEREESVKEREEWKGRNCKRETSVEGKGKERKRH